jgi:nucleoside-diphosphate-sugar epimerase
MAPASGKTLFCFGFGLSAETLARRLLPEGWRVVGTTRRLEKADAMRRMGIEPAIFTGEAPMAAESRRLLRSASHILVSVPPGDAGDAVIRCHGMDIGVDAALEWLGYLSTTGVYGDRGGQWVDEESPRRPSTSRGRSRVDAEDAWLTLYKHGRLPVHLFRLAGIYGPGRNQLETLKAGTAKRIVKDGQVFSRIHVEDLAAVLEASIRNPNPGRAYNVCDDLAASPEDVLLYAAKLLGTLPPPAIPYERATLSAMAQSFYSENKRVRNDRIKRELGVRLSYPTYREGLASFISREARSA